jgi:hypothetical protein
MVGVTVNFFFNLVNNTFEEDNFLDYGRFTAFASSVLSD